MQIDDLLYYIAAEDISEGSELRVWYTTFYQEKMKEELKSLGYNRSLVGSAVVVRKPAGSHHMPHLTAALQVSPSLSKIVVGKGQVTFTHNAGGREYETGLQNKPVLLSGDFVVAAPSYNVPWIREGQMSKPKMGLQGESNSLTDQRRGRLDANGPKPILGTADVVTKPSIELVNEKNDTHLKERIVTFSITAASPIPRIKSRPKERNLQAPTQGMPREVDSKPPANMNNSSILPGAVTGKKMTNRHKELKSGKVILIFLFSFLFYLFFLSPVMLFMLFPKTIIHTAYKHEKYFSLTKELCTLIPPCRCSFSKLPHRETAPSSCLGSP